MRDKSLALLAAAAGLTLAAAVAVTQYDKPAGPAGAGAPLFPALAAAVNDVARIELVGARGLTTLIRDDAGRWTVQERGGYPAGRDAVKNLAVGLASATLAEPRTADAELYPRIGVEEPETPAAAGVRATLRAADGGVLAAVVVGKPANPSSIGAGPGQVYVRRAGETQSWLAVTPLDPIRADPAFWLERGLPQPGRDQIQSLEIRDPSGATLTLKRGEGDAARGFVAEGLPPGAALDENVAAEALGALGFLAFEDVGPYDSLLFAMSPLYVYRTRDGGTVKVRAARRDGAAWVELSAEGLTEDYARAKNRAFRVFEGTADALSRPAAGYVAVKSLE